MKFRGLHVEFGSSKRDCPEAPRTPSPRTSAAIPTAEMVAPLQKAEEKNSTELDELSLREQQIEELLLTDPLVAEEMIRLGELEDTNGSEYDDS